MKETTKKNTTILITAGGTGGHFFPALALAEELADQSNLDLHISTDNRCKKYCTNNVASYHIIDLYINLKGIINKIKLPFLVLIALIKSVLLIKSIKPSIIIGFGGYPSFPIMLAGQLLSVPTIIYEQNSFFGKTNKFFAKKAKLIAVAYQNTKNLPQEYLSKSIIVGDVVRKNIANLQQKDNFDEDPFNLLVIGGSQGARIFSSLIPESIKILIGNHPEIRINITQQVQVNDQETVKNIYDDLKVDNLVADFFHNIHEHYQKSQLIIARAGATTIAELTQIGLPAIYIPLPTSADDHQYHNAESLQYIKASWVYRQSEINPVILSDKLYNLIKNRSEIKAASLNLLKRKVNGARHLADTVLKIISQL